MSRMPLLGLVLPLLTLLTGACDDGDEVGAFVPPANEAIVPIDCAAAEADTTVAITTAGFSPATVTVATTAVVRWVNTDTVAHSVVSGTPLSTSPTIPINDDEANTGTDTGDGGGIIGGIGSGPVLIGPILTPGALFNSGPLSRNQAFCLNFNDFAATGQVTGGTAADEVAAGVTYHCEIHPTETGRVEFERARE